MMINGGLVVVVINDYDDNEQHCPEEKRDDMPYQTPGKTIQNNGEQLTGSQEKTL